MSGTPKWSEIQLERRRARALEEERRRRAAEERRRREEAERRAREALIADLQLRTERLRTTISATLSQARAEGLDVQAPGALQRLEIELTRAAAGGSDLSTVTSQFARAEDLARRTQIVADQLRQRQMQAERARGELETEAAALERLVRDTRARSSDASVVHLEPTIAQTLSLAGQTPEEVAKARATLRELARPVEEAANAGALVDDWIATRRAALQVESAPLRAERSLDEQAIEITQMRFELQAVLEGCRADDVLMTWEGQNIERLIGELHALNTSAGADAVRAIRACLDESLQRAQARQLAEERRMYIVQSLQKAMADQGFEVGDARLTGDDYDSEVAFHATRIDRRALAVSVPLDGPVIYDIDGVEQITEVGEDGLAYTDCASTEERLTALHANLAAQFGIEAGELLWESKDPLRAVRTARSLPTSAAKERHR